jgi:hypothetical protein
MKRRIFEQKLERIPELISEIEIEIDWRRARPILSRFLLAVLILAVVLSLRFPLGVAIISGYILALNALILKYFAKKVVPIILR